MITTIETPQLDQISPLEWMITTYSPLQQKEIDELIKKHIWVTARRIKINVRQMETSHIINCINCYTGKGEVVIPDSYLGGRTKWMKIFNEELINRQ